MLDLLITSKVRRKIICLFAINPDEEFYLRQVARELNEPVNSVRLEIDKLSNGGILSKSANSGRAYFTFNQNYRYARQLQEIVAGMRESPDFNQFTDFKRRRRLEKELSKLVSEIVDKYHPEKIILYGSLATGKIKPTSDIDIVIVKDTKKTYYDRVRELAKLCDYNVGVDILIYTPQEFDEMKERAFFREEVLKKGMTIYDKAA